MDFQVVAGAMLRCSFGLVPSTLNVLPFNKFFDTMPAANIMDYKPFANILPFVMCTSMANPTVAAATTAAMGVLTPMPCVPATAAPWSPGSTKFYINRYPALTDKSRCMCSYAGTISIIYPGQVMTMIQ